MGEAGFGYEREKPMSYRSKLASANHWVIKIGSGVLVRDARFIDRPTFTSLVQGIHHLLEAGHQVTVVSSGAVALGRRALPHVELSQDLPELQALAALGQARLIRMWDDELRHYDRRAAQVLFGRADLDRREGFLNARLAIEAIHRLKIVPVINENDTIATEGLRFDDNDELAGMTSGLVQADVLVILSDVDGVYDVETQDGERHFTKKFDAIAADDPYLDVIAGPSVSGVGRGGMISKIAAARAACRFGMPCVIAPGKSHGVLEQIRAGGSIGTVITPSHDGVQGRRVWLGGGALAVGSMRCDDGAVTAVTLNKASLLARGVLDVEGDWPEGSVIDLVSPTGVVFARGLSVYSATEMQQIKGRHSDDIEEILGFKNLDVVVHRDSLVLL